MKFLQKSFTVPATNPTKTPCAIHHIVKGKCLRCDVKVVQSFSKDEAAQIDEVNA